MSGLGINPNLLIAQIVNFLVVLLLLRLFLYQPLARMFEERRQRIASGLEEAERARQEAAAERSRLVMQFDEERRVAQSRLREAVARSEDAARRRLEEANTEAQQIVREAREEAETARRQALVGLQDEIAELALAAAAKALGEGVDEATHRRLIDRFLAEQFGSQA